MGPLVSDEQFRRVYGYVASGLNEGARSIAGGRKAGDPGYFDKGYFLEPTILADTRQDMKVAQEEIFGPVVALMPFENTDDLVNKANDTIYELAAGIGRSDINKAHKFASTIHAGTVWINCYNIFDAALPFGGYNPVGVAKCAVKLWKFILR